MSTPESIFGGPESITNSDTVAQKRTARAVTVAVIGDWLQVFDFTVHGFFAATIGRLCFPASDSTTSLLLAVATFAAGFSARLLGSLLLGVHSDWQVARYSASMATAWAERPH